jgi:putative Ca2+/H+ antiporter (TMEM165/GDT1 family)
VWAGAALALVLVSGLGVCVGQVCGNYLPRELISRIAGAIFIVMGILMVAKII